jgi:hypothetical protein
LAEDVKDARTGMGENAENPEDEGLLREEHMLNTRNRERKRTTLVTRQSGWRLAMKYSIWTKVKEA